MTDEANFSLEYKDRDLFMEMLHVFYTNMYVRVKGWNVPFDVGLELGTAWGDSFPFDYDMETRELKPSMKYVGDKKEEVKPVEVVEEKPEEEEDIVFDINF